MKKLRGTALNIETSVIGAVTYKPIFRRSQRQKFILITNKDKGRDNYAAIIFTQFPTRVKKIPLLYNVDDIGQLNDGDILEIQPDGVINILYEKGSFDNALMITERCNCSCIMCPQPPLAVEEDKTAFNIKLISLMDKKTPYLGLTGGEPTMVGDNLFDIIKSCKKNLPKAKLNLLTNGIRFSDFDYTKKFVDLNHPNIFVEVPLYADTDTDHNNIIGAKGFYKTLSGLYNLASFNQRIGIRIVILKLNYSRLDKISEFIYRNFPFVFHIAFMQMETIGLAQENIESLWIDPFDYNEHLEKAITYLVQRDLDVSIYNAQLCVLRRNLWKYARKSISSWKNIYIEECEKCEYCTDCGGLFASSKDKHSTYLKAIKKLDEKT